MKNVDVISMTRTLISMNTVNPPGNEKKAALYTGEILRKEGFAVNYHTFSEGRLHVIAEKGITSYEPPVVLSGHLDVVPVGKQKWTIDPFKGEVFDGKIFGRGSSDMKAGVAALVFGAISSFYENPPAGGVRIILTAGEEQGCQGIQHLVKTYESLGSACGIIVAEPTANIPAIGHKGGLYLNITMSGKTAHSSMPELGDNAIYKAARAIVRLEKFVFGAEKDPLLGYPTLNIGMMSGGQNLNSVPDYAAFTVDARTTTRVDHQRLLEKLKSEVGSDAVVEVLVDLKPVSTNSSEAFVQRVFDACNTPKENREFPCTLPYLTDGSVLQPFYGNVPAIILGPGQPELAHKTDEFCYLNKINEAVEIYKRILCSKK